MNIKRLYLEDCTLGVLTYKNFDCYTLELPWKDNRNGVSCIPEGEYEVEKISTTKHPKAYILSNPKKGVYKYQQKGRFAIMIHTGNTVRDIEGCILPGEQIGHLYGLKAVLSSTKAFNNIWDRTPDKFTLTIGN